MIQNNDKIWLNVALPLGNIPMYPTGLTKLKRLHRKKDRYRAGLIIEVTGDIVFFGADYQALYTYECSNVREGVISAEVIRETPYGSRVVARISFALNEATWNLDDCTVKVKVRPDTNIVNQSDWDKEYNLFELAASDIESKYQSQQVVIKNGILLRDAVEALCSVVGLDGVISSLLQWNTSSPQPFGLNVWDRLVIHQLSDVLRANTTSLISATKLSVSLADILNDLCILYNARWDIDSRNSLIIEHVSYWQQIQAHDVTVGTDAQLNLRGRSYTYQNEEMPANEVFTMKNASKPFAGWPLEYAVPSALLKVNDGESEAHQFKFFTTDLRTLHTQRLNSIQSGQIPSAEAMTGALLVALDANDNVIDGDVYAPFYSPGQYDVDWNGVMAMSYTMPLCWTYDRPFRKGFINDSLFDLQKRRTRLQGNVKMRFCPAPQEPEFTFQGLIKTTLGWGEIAEAEEDISTGMISISVLHDDIPPTLQVPMTQAANIDYTIAAGDIMDFTDPVTMAIYNWPPLTSLLPGEYVRPFERFSGNMKVFADGTIFFDTGALGGYQGGNPVPFVYSFEYVIINALGFTSQAIATIHSI